MNIQTFQSFIPSILRGIEGVESVTINDYNAESVDLFIEVEKRFLNKKLRSLSNEIRKVLKTYGFSKKNGTIIEWIAPVKTQNQWKQTEIKTTHFYIDFIYAYTNLKIDTLKDKVYVFDKHNTAGNSSKIMEDIFKYTFEYIQENEFNEDKQTKHFEVMNEFAGDNYTIVPLWRYSKSGYNHYELSKRGSYESFDSGLVGCIAIKNGSDIEAIEIVNNINEFIEE